MKIKEKDLLMVMAKKEMNFIQLAELSGISKVTMSYIKNGKSCKPDIAGKIAKALEVEPEEIFTIN